MCDERDERDELMPLWRACGHPRTADNIIRNGHRRGIQRYTCRMCTSARNLSRYWRDPEAECARTKRIYDDLDFIQRNYRLLRHRRNKALARARERNERRKQWQQEN